MLRDAMMPESVEGLLNSMREAIARAEAIDDEDDFDHARELQAAQAAVLSARARVDTLAADSTRTLGALDTHLHELADWLASYEDISRGYYGWEPDGEPLLQLIDQLAAGRDRLSDLERAMAVELEGYRSGLLVPEALRQFHDEIRGMSGDLASELGRLVETYTTESEHMARQHQAADLRADQLQVRIAEVRVHARSAEEALAATRRRLALAQEHSSAQAERAQDAENRLADTETLLERAEAAGAADRGRRRRAEVETALVQDEIAGAEAQMVGLAKAVVDAQLASRPALPTSAPAPSPSPAGACAGVATGRRDSAGVGTDHLSPRAAIALGVVARQGTVEALRFALDGDAAPAVGTALVRMVQGALPTSHPRTLPPSPERHATHAGGGAAEGPRRADEVSVRELRAALVDSEAEARHLAAQLRAQTERAEANQRHIEQLVTDEVAHATGATALTTDGAQGDEGPAMQGHGGVRRADIAARWRAATRLQKTVHRLTALHAAEKAAIAEAFRASLRAVEGEQRAPPAPPTPLGTQAVAGGPAVPAGR